ncbi:hypothetical protein GCM10022234_36010 [Aeromicrobium panaciterrae]
MASCAPLSNAHHVPEGVERTHECTVIGYPTVMRLAAGLIVGLVAGAVMYAVTEQLLWLPAGAFMGVFIGELRVRRRER